MEIKECAKNCRGEVSEGFAAKEAMTRNARRSPARPNSTALTRANGRIVNADLPWEEIRDATKSPSDDGL
jgi:hypothetical protein